MPRRPAFRVRAEEEQLIGSAPPSLIDSLQGRGDDAWAGNENREQPSLGVKLTGYRLLNVGVILIFGVTKAALAYCGRSSALTTLDWVAGASSAIILYWVGQVESRSKRQSRWSLFFHVDWAPEILETMKSVDIPLAPLEYVLYSNKLNCCAQDSRPAGPGLRHSLWSLDALVDLLRRHLDRNYMSPLTIAFLYITLPHLETSSLFLAP